MALFNKDSLSKSKHSNSSSEQDISSIKSSMSQQQPTNAYKESFINSSSNTPNNKNQPLEEFVNPFSQPNSNPQEQPQPFNSSNPQFTNNSLPSLQSTSPQNFNDGSPSNNSPKNPLPSFQEAPMQINQPEMQNTEFQQIQKESPNSFNPQGYSNSAEYISKEEVENLIYETTEKILEQQWENLTGKVQKVIDWKSSVESEVEGIKEDINTMQEAFATLEKRLISKLNNYDKSILDVGSEIKALDKVFQKVTPTLVNNVTELGKIAKDLKGVSLQNSNSKTKDSNKEE